MFKCSYLRIFSSANGDVTVDGANVLVGVGGAVLLPDPNQPPKPSISLHPPADEAGVLLGVSPGSSPMRSSLPT